MDKRPIAILTFLLLPLSFLISAETLPEQKPTEKKESSAAVIEAHPKEDEFVITKHSVKINGAEINYSAQVGTMSLKDEEGKPKGDIFYIAYTKEGEENNPNRPVTFCFNGGPGSSSVWLHLGAFGPNRIAMTDEGAPLHPFHLVDNEYSLLDLTDLVFIDPISTGYSRAAPGVKAKDFHSVEQDVNSVAQFVRLYTTRYGRWESPKFLAGESYGTTRSAELAYKLHDEDCMEFEGIIMISSVLNYQTFTFHEGNDLPYLLFFPTYAATAWYHKRLNTEYQQDLQKTLEEARQFAFNEYAVALIKGNDLVGEERKAIAEKMSRFTGLTASYIEAHNLRFDESQFSLELLKDNRRFVGRFDSRILGIDNYNSSKDYTSYDPSYSNICGAFAATFYQYAKKELKWEKDDQYIVLANIWPWDYGKAGNNQYLYAGNSLSKTMTENTRLRVYVASGEYDLATPPGTTDYAFKHLDLDPSLRKNITMETFASGHMVYLDKPGLVKLKNDLIRFYKGPAETNP